MRFSYYDLTETTQSNPQFDISMFTFVPINFIYIYIYIAALFAPTDIYIYIYLPNQKPPHQHITMVQ